MEKLATLNQTDISNGVLNRMLASAGIPDVPEYVRQFHQQTEHLILDDLEHADPNQADHDEQIVPPADLQRWIAGLRPRLDDSIQQPLLPKQQTLPPKQQPLSGDVQSWTAGFRPQLDDPIQPLPPVQQEERRPLPVDLNSWAQGITPVHIVSTIDNSGTETATTTNDDSSVTADLGTALRDWSRSLTEQPPPASLDTWLQSLVSKNMHEPLGKATSSKGRVNSYLNAAQEVLAKHGYDVSTEATAPTDVKVKTGMFGNVKQMYFLWKALDKNNDRKITVEDVQIMMQEMGLGFVSKYAAQTLFEMVDSNHDGELQFRDFIALMSIIKQLVSAMGSAKIKA